MNASSMTGKWRLSYAVSRLEEQVSNALKSPLVSRNTSSKDGSESASAINHSESPVSPTMTGKVSNSHGIFSDSNMPTISWHPTSHFLVISMNLWISCGMSFTTRELLEGNLKHLMQSTMLLKSYEKKSSSSRCSDEGISVSRWIREPSQICMQYNRTSLLFASNTQSNRSARQDISRAWWRVKEESSQARYRICRYRWRQELIIWCSPENPAMAHKQKTASRQNPNTREKLTRNCKKVRYLTPHSPPNHLESSYI